MVTTHEHAAAVAERFAIPGDFVGAEPFGSGHINDTYAATFDQGGTRVRYILQRVNHQIFKDVPALMENMLRVTRHAAAKLCAAGCRDITRRVLTVIPARDGAGYVRDASGNFWRSLVFIEHARTHDRVRDARQAYEAARAFGEFQTLLADLPGERLHETIPQFHHTRSRFDRLVDAIAADSSGRVRNAGPEIEFFLSREPISDVLLDLLAAGEIPERATHNDTKLNNVLIDDTTGTGVCVVDLDTVMPGLALYDFGDLVRTSTSPALEDEPDVSHVTMQLPMFEALVAGYLSAAGQVLNARETALLPFAGKLITFETGCRFLTDYLQGDVYFKVKQPDHNLVRCRTQIALVESIEAQEAAMQAVVTACAS